MPQNKLKSEDCCLTIEQAKELQALGINMDNCLMEFCSLKDLGDYHLLPKHKYENNFILWKYIPTLTNTEMLEMIPLGVRDNDKLFIFKSPKTKKDKRGVWVVQYVNIKGQLYMSYANKLLRDSLFGIIKELKENKLI